MSDTGREDSRTNRLIATDDVNAEVRGRPLLYAGVIWIGIFRRFLIPRTCTHGQLVTPYEPLQAKEPMVQSVSHTAETKPDILHIVRKNMEEENNKDMDQRNLIRHQEINISESPLVSVVSQIQDVSEEVAHQIRQLSYNLSEIVMEGKAATLDKMDTMRAEHMLKLRYGAITLCGLVGYLAGLRRGAVTRMVYSATGATAMTVLLYPAEARHYNILFLAAVHQAIVLSLELFRNEAIETGNEKTSEESGETVEGISSVQETDMGEKFDLKLTDEENFNKTINLRSAKEHPLNKNLSRFYVKQPENSLTSPEKRI